MQSQNVKGDQTVLIKNFLTNMNMEVKIFERREEESEHQLEERLEVLQVEWIRRSAAQPSQQSQQHLNQYFYLLSHLFHSRLSNSNTWPGTASII